MARPKNPDTIPTSPGVYSIWEIHDANTLDTWNNCLYVGMASNLRNRINQHYLLLRYLKSLHDVEVRYQICTSDQLQAIEAQMLKDHNPTLNRYFPASLKVIKV